jgi:hypothetical protein
LDVEGAFVVSSFAGSNPDRFFSRRNVSALSPRTVEDIVERVQVAVFVFLQTFEDVFERMSCDALMPVLKWTEALWKKKKLS